LRSQQRPFGLLDIASGFAPKPTSTPTSRIG
jgi:hypothetical protein